MSIMDPVKFFENVLAFALQTKGIKVGKILNDRCQSSTGTNLDIQRALLMSGLHIILLYKSSFHFFFLPFYTHKQKENGMNYSA